MSGTEHQISCRTLANVRAILVSVGLTTLFGISNPSPTQASTWLEAPLTPLVTLEIPRCPNHIGRKEYRSETIARGGIRAFITATARRSKQGCESNALLTFDINGKSHSLKLPDSMDSFDLVDFSPDGSSILIDGQIARSYPDESFRYIQIATVGVASTEIEWHDTWDLLDWKDCDAMVEPQGFTSDGAVVVLVRAAALLPSRRRDCLGEGYRPAAFYYLDLKTHTGVVTPRPLQVVRYGMVVEGPSRPCKTDPDLAGPCFNLRGRLTFGNGTPGTRIWRVGTKRILGVPDDTVLPVGIHYTEDNVFGDFTVCPLTPHRPGEMQMVCIESASNLTIRRR